MHRRGYAYSSGGVTAGGTGGSGHRGGADGGSGILAGYAGILGGAGAGKGLGPGESWDWEDAWERMPHDLRVNNQNLDAVRVCGSVNFASLSGVLFRCCQFLVQLLWLLSWGITERWYMECGKDRGASNKRVFVQHKFMTC